MSEEAADSVLTLERLHTVIRKLDDEIHGADAWAFREVRGLKIEYLESNQATGIIVLDCRGDKMGKDFAIVAPVGTMRTLRDVMNDFCEQNHFIPVSERFILEDIAARHLLAEDWP